MKTLSFSTLFLPEWALPWVLVLAITAWILGARPLAIAAAFIFMFEVIVAPLLAPWLATLPTPALLLIGAVMALMIFHGAIELLFGKRPPGTSPACTSCACSMRSPWALPPARPVAARHHRPVTGRPTTRNNLRNPCAPMIRTFNIDGITCRLPNARAQSHCIHRP
jgi:hypothetical protein